jgi:hypothetical protein
MNISASAVLKAQFLFLLIMLQGCSTNGSDLDFSFQGNSWVLAGYRKSDPNGDIAYKVLDSAPIPNGWGYSQRFSIISRFDCESIYSEVALLDKNGATIGWTNSGVDAPVKAGAVSILAFQSDKQFASVLSKELNCR